MEDDDEKKRADVLARALDGEGGGSPEDLAAARRIRAAAGGAPRLGELAARALIRRAAARAGRPRRRWPMVVTALSAVAALLLALTLWRRPPSLPARLCSRTAGALVPGPFPTSETAAQRLDRVAADRLVAYRELRARGRR